MTAEERFWSKVQRTEHCWFWQAGKFSDGYGAFGFERKLWKAHRWSYTQYVGLIPAGMVVMHSCDEPACVRPEHLSLGTPQENHRDSMRKGRTAWQRYAIKPPRRDQRGALNAMAKLSAKDIEQIQNRYCHGEKQQKIADDYGVKQSCISKIVNRKRWEAL